MRRPAMIVIAAGSLAVVVMVVAVLASSDSPERTGGPSAAKQPAAQRPKPTPRPRDSWVGDYEGGFEQWADLQFLPGRARLVAEPKRQGRRAARFEVRPGDDPIGANGERAEVLTDVAEGGGTEGKEAWYGWSTRFPADLNPSTGKGSFNIFTQWHENVPGKCLPPLSFMVEAPPEGPRMRLRMRGGRELPGCMYETQRDFDLGPVRRDRWYDFVVHVKWSADPAQGFVEAAVNGRRVVPRTPGATLYPGAAVYLKQGWYRTESPATSVVFHDGMKRGRSYRAVEPGAD